MQKNVPRAAVATYFWGAFWEHGTVHKATWHPGVPQQCNAVGITCISFVFSLQLCIDLICEQQASDRLSLNRLRFDRSSLLLCRAGLSHLGGNRLLKFQRPDLEATPPPHGDITSIGALCRFP